MKNHSFSLLLIATMLLTLAACTQAASEAATPGSPTAAHPSTPLATQLKPSLQVSLAYPAPGELPPGEDAMVQPFIESAALSMSTTVPAQPVLKVTGDLPTGCHTLQYKVAPPDTNHQVRVSLAVVPPAPHINCIQVVKTIEKEIPLGNLAPGLYQVLINGQKVGSLQVP